ncbi:MAG: VWA domain-containing protein [Candidatus Woesearchaeota archaeon]
MAFSVEGQVKGIENAEEAKGKLATQFVEDKLMHAVISSDKTTIDNGKLISESFNQSIGSFIPDMIFANIVKNFSIAKQLYGETMLRILTGYDPNYVQKNLGIPEFRKELQNAITEKIEELRRQGLVDDYGQVCQKGVELAGLVMYAEELDRIIPKETLGQWGAKQKSIYGEPGEAHKYRKGERYKDIAIRQSIKTAVKRRHKELAVEDLSTHRRESKGTINVIYAIDASASMKGKKLETCKKAGVALAYKAISEKDRVGLVVFGTEVKDAVAPTDDFGFLLHRITRITASRQTDFARMIRKASEMFMGGKGTNHLIILTDALPTVGKEPEKETLEAVSAARALGITISLIGIQLDRKGIVLAEQMARLGEGKFSIVQDIENLDRIVLQDYYALASR